MTGDLYVVSGPSGAGKGTLLSLVMSMLDNIWLSVSATTRKPRTGELEGLHYFFISNEEFDNLISMDGLLEWASVHGERYGTLRSEVETRLAEGIDVILEIDPQGALQVLSKEEQAVLIFIEPPSLEELERRLKGRGTENADAIQKRMADSLELWEYREQYHYVIVNDDLTTAAHELYDLFTDLRKKRKPYVFDATSDQRAT